ncbi:MAG: hypothetical protein ABIK28_13630, partial [Planctomycetota bacterium]
QCRSFTVEVDANVPHARSELKMTKAERTYVNIRGDRALCDNASFGIPIDGDTWLLIHHAELQRQDDYNYIIDTNNEDNNPLRLVNCDNRDYTLCIEKNFPKPYVQAEIDDLGHVSLDRLGQINVYGHVFMGNRPLRDARVCLTYKNNCHIRNRFIDTPSAFSDITDANGYYWLSLPSSGEYAIFLYSESDFRLPLLNNDLLSIPDGRPFKLDLKTDFISLNGKIRDHLTGEPVADAQIRISCKDALCGYSESNINGQFKLNCSGYNDSIEIVVCAKGYPPHPFGLKNKFVLHSEHFDYGKMIDIYLGEGSGSLRLKIDDSLLRQSDSNTYMLAKKIDSGYMDIFFDACCIKEKGNSYLVNGLPAGDHSFIFKYEVRNEEKEIRFNAGIEENKVKNIEIIESLVHADQGLPDIDY